MLWRRRAEHGRGELAEGQREFAKACEPLTPLARIITLFPPHEAWAMRVILYRLGARERYRKAYTLWLWRTHAIAMAEARRKARIATQKMYVDNNRAKPNNDTSSGCTFCIVSIFTPMGR